MIVNFLQYEHMLTIIRSDTRRLRDFERLLKEVKYPVRDFPKLVCKSSFMFNYYDFPCHLIRCYGEAKL